MIIVSKATSYCTGTVQAQGWEMLKQVSFKPGPEDCPGRCGSDKICNVEVAIGELASALGTVNDVPCHQSVCNV